MGCDADALFRIVCCMISCRCFFRFFIHFTSSILHCIILFVYLSRSVIIRFIIVCYDHGFGFVSKNFHIKFFVDKLKYCNNIYRSFALQIKLIFIFPILCLFLVFMFSIIWSTIRLISRSLSLSPCLIPALRLIGFINYIYYF